MFPLNENLQPLLMIAGIGILCWMMMRSRLKSRSRNDRSLAVDVPLKSNAGSHNAATAFSGTSTLGAPREVLKWQVELYDLGRELKAELDCKIIAADKLRRSYEEASRKLESLVSEAKQLESQSNSPLSQAKQLANLGWEPSKISSALGLPQRDIETLLRL